MGTPARPAGPAVSTGSRPATESKALLSQCRDLARSKLSRIVAEALDKVENDLFAAAEASTSRAEQQVLFEAMSQVKAHRGEISSSFDRYFIEIYDRRIATRGPEPAGRRAEPRRAHARRRRRDGRGNGRQRPRAEDPEPHRSRAAARHPRPLRTPALERAGGGRHLQPALSRGGLRSPQDGLRQGPRRLRGQALALERIPALRRGRHHHRLRRREPEPHLAPRPAAHPAPGEARRRHRRRGQSGAGARARR